MSLMAASDSITSLYHSNFTFTMWKPISAKKTKQIHQMFTHKRFLKIQQVSEHFEILRYNVDFLCQN